MNHSASSRAGRTRLAIVQAFNRLFLRSPRPRSIGARDVMAEAGVGRSTFYDHFSSAEQVHLAALAVPFATFADAAAGKGDVSATARLLEHFWDNRARARQALAGRLGEQTGKLLAELVETRLPAPLVIEPRLAAEQCAAAALAPVRAWLLGYAPASPEVLAAAICGSGAALIAVLRAGS